MDQKDHILLGHAPSKCINGVNCFSIEKIVSVQLRTGSNLKSDTFDYISTKYSDLTILKLHKGQEFESMGIHYKEFLNRFTERGKITQKQLHTSLYKQIFYVKSRSSDLFFNWTI